MLCAATGGDSLRGTAFAVLSAQISKPTRGGASTGGQIQLIRAGFRGAREHGEGFAIAAIVLSGLFTGCGRLPSFDQNQLLTNCKDTVMAKRTRAAIDAPKLITSGPAAPLLTFSWPTRIHWQ